MKERSHAGPSTEVQNENVPARGSLQGGAGQMPERGSLLREVTPIVRTSAALGEVFKQEDEPLYGGISVDPHDQGQDTTNAVE